MIDKKPPILGESFKKMMKKVREIEEIKNYLDSPAVHLGNYVFARKTELGYSQQQLAKLAGTTQSEISKIEFANVDQYVDGDVLNRVLKALK